MRVLHVGELPDAMESPLDVGEASILSFFKGFSCHKMYVMALWRPACLHICPKPQLPCRHKWLRCQREQRISQD